MTMAKIAEPQALERAEIDQALERLEVDPSRGLSGEEARRRKRELGANRIEERVAPWYVRLLKNFWGPIPWMLEIAAALAVLRGIHEGRWEDFGVIFTMLLINGGVSFWHENKAQNAIEALKQRLAPEARVRRGGELRNIDASELVPGDIISVRMGDLAPADAKLLESEHIAMDESALTGESLPVGKDPGDVLYSGTSAKRGQAEAVVVATGTDTKFGRTVELVQEAEQISHFRRAVLRIGYFLIGATAVLVAIVLGVSLWRGVDWWMVAFLALGLTLAGIPQALPAVLSVTMTVGARRLARMEAIVSRLASMEEMAGLEVLCADKTGTLTKNELELQEPSLIEAKDGQQAIVAAALTCERDEPDPIDRAILNALDGKDGLEAYEVTEFQPFDPTRKRADAKVRGEEGVLEVSKGAPQAVMELVDADEDVRGKVEQAVDDLGEQGFRALGVARRDDDGAWRYLAVLPLLDPPRSESAEVVEDAKAHGIDVRMVTGDHAAIGRKVAGQIGMGEAIESAGELFGDHQQFDPGTDESRRRRVIEADGYSEVTPEHKFNIIRAFQSEDRIVGMTGDGVNDAPALKQADVGIAVSAATDAARSAADLVLTRRGLGVIIAAVEEARRIFERMSSYAAFRITESARVLLFVTASVLAFGSYPVTPIMIVLLAILNDIPIMAIAWDHAPTPRRPVRWQMPRILTIASVLAIGGVIESFILYLGVVNFWPDWGLVAGTATEPGVALAQTAQTIMFLKLLVAGHMTIFLTRHRDRMWSKPWPSLTLFIPLEGTQIVGTLFAVYGVLMPPIGWANAGIVWGFALVWIVMLDWVKTVTHRVLDRFGRDAARVD